MADSRVWLEENQREWDANDLDHLRALEEAKDLLQQWRENTKDEELGHKIRFHLKCLEKVLYINNRSSIDETNSSSSTAEEVVTESKQLLLELEDLSNEHALVPQHIIDSGADQSRAQSSLEELKNEISYMRLTVQLKLRAAIRALQEQEQGGTASFYQGVDEEEAFALCSAFKSIKRKVHSFAHLLELQSTMQEYIDKMKKKDKGKDPASSSSEEPSAEEVARQTAAMHAATMAVEMQHTLAVIRGELFELLGQPEDFVDDRTSMSEDEQDRNVKWLQQYGKPAQLQEEIGLIQHALLWGRKKKKKKGKFASNPKRERRLSNVTAPTPFHNESVLQYNYRVVEEKLNQLAGELHVPCLDVMLCRKYFLDDQSEENLIRLTEYVGILVDMRDGILELLKAVTQREEILYQLQKLSKVVEKGNFNRIDMQTSVFQWLFGLQQITLTVVEGIASWRKYLTRPFPFEWQGMNYLLKLHNDCRALDCGWLKTILPLKLTNFPLCSNLQSLSLFAPPDDLQSSSMAKQQTPNVDPAFTKRLKMAETIVRDEVQVQTSLVKELDALVDGRRFLPLVHCADIIPNCYTGIKLSDNVYKSWGPKLRKAIQQSEQGLTAMQKHADQIVEAGEKVPADRSASATPTGERIEREPSVVEQVRNSTPPPATGPPTKTLQADAPADSAPAAPLGAPASHQPTPIAADCP
eukprot:TRINITY_DN68040_c3_g1_i1.p1 TRINITY_DN68040_c3_g1~~TRINITY_DN68040_c3_g1_i1.p1  ORF type:complete len:696 (-),score=64.88 TRINITY_DN68040_c3_g1_i1:1694-3781(-)